VLYLSAASQSDYKAWLEVLKQNIEFSPIKAAGINLVRDRQQSLVVAEEEVVACGCCALFSEALRVA
jgi:hypothetical protein